MNIAARFCLERPEEYFAGPASGGGFRASLENAHTPKPFVEAGIVHGEKENPLPRKVTKRDTPRHPAREKRDSSVGTRYSVEPDPAGRVSYAVNFSTGIPVFWTFALSGASGPFCGSLLIC